MMRFLITILLTISGFIAIGNNIDQVNTIKKKAETAFSNKKFSDAALNYELLIDSFKVNTPSVQLNLAHCYYGMDSLQKAKNIYTSISNSEIKQYASISYQQLGKITVTESKIQLTKNNYENTTPEQISALKTALTYFKKSIKNNPSNTDSRYNYEAISKWLKNMPEDKKEDQEKHEKKQKEKEDQQKKDEEKKQKDQQKKDGEKKEDKDSKNDKKEDKDAENKKEKGKDGEKKEDKNKKDKGEKSDQEKKGEKSEEEKSEEGKEGEKNKKKEEGEKKGEGKEKSEEERQKEEQGKPSKEEKKKQEAKQREAQVQQRLEEHNLSKEKALQLLNTIDQQEKKYLQQQERKSQSNGNDNDKPDW